MTAALPAVADSSSTTDSYGTNTLTVRTYYDVETTGCGGMLGYRLDHMTFKYVREDSRWTAGFDHGAMGVLGPGCTMTSWQRSKNITGPSNLVSGQAYSRDFGTPSNWMKVSGGVGDMNAHVALNLYLSGGPQRGLCALAGPFQHATTGTGCN